MEVVHGCGMCHPSMMFSARAFQLAGRYREDYWPAEDADLVLRIAEKGRLTNIDEPLLSYQVHGDSIGHRQAGRQREALFRLPLLLPSAVAALRRPRRFVNSFSTIGTASKPRPRATPSGRGGR